MRIRDELTYKVIGAAMEVHKNLGCGFTEKVYQDALEKEFQIQRIPYEREVRMRVMYKGENLDSEFIPDFVCYDKMIVELKAVEELTDLHKAQTINYLHVSRMSVALLFNFGAESLEFQRFNACNKSS
jgi:GxxExxY protein